jgi:PAS domain S-box-containing protein
MTAGAAAGRGGASGVRRWLRGRAVRLALVLGLALAYGLAFPWLRSRLGTGAALLATVLIILGGLLFGKRGGLLVGVAVPIYNTLLLNLAGDTGWDAALRETSGLGALAAIAIGLIIGHMRDLAQALERQVAEQQQARAALRESQQLFESAFRHAAIGMALVAPDGRWLQANPALCELVGYAEPELLRTTFQAITHPDDLETDLDNVRQILAGAIPTYQMEKRYLHKAGHVIWVLLNVSLVRDSQGQPQFFLSQIQDITERKQVELALRESEARYRDLFEASSVSLWEQDFSAVRGRLAELRQQGVTDFRAYFQRYPAVAAECAALVRITDVNPATLRLYGAASKAELLQGLDQVFMDDSLAGFGSELAAIAEGKTEFDGESTNRTLAGERLVVHVRWSVARGHEATFTTR